MGGDTTRHFPIWPSLVTSDSRNRFTVAAEFGTRNISVAAVIAVSLLGRADFARFAATYVLGEVPVMVVAILLFRRRSLMTVPAG
jgi:hypothetical protein